MVELVSRYIDMNEFTQFLIKGLMGGFFIMLLSLVPRKNSQDSMKSTLMNFCEGQGCIIATNGKKQLK